MQQSDGVAGKAANCVAQLPTIPEQKEVGPYNMQTIWRRVWSVLGKRKYCTIAPALDTDRRTQECKKLGAFMATTAAGTRTVVVVAPDTCAEVSMIRAGAEDASWTEVQAAPITAQGLSVENNSRVTAAVSYEDVTHSKQVDVMKHTTESLVTEMGCKQNRLFAGPNCQQFSSANPEAKGMAST